MNFNLKSVAFTLLAFFAVNTLSAQRGQQKMTAEQHAEKQTERMVEQLALTENQANQVAALNLKYAKKKEGLKATADENTDRKAAMKQMRDAQDAELKGILNAEQLTKYETMRAEKKGRKKGGKRGDKVSNRRADNAKSPEQRAEMKTARLTKELSLNDTQVARINAIHWEFEKKVQMVKESEEAEGGQKADLRALRTERDVAVKEVLTAEQAAKFDAREKRGGKKGARRS